MATFDEFYESLPEDSNKSGEYFEKVFVWFLKTDPEWSTQVEEVWSWDEYPPDGARTAVLIWSTRTVRAITGQFRASASHQNARSQRRKSTVS